VARDGACVAVVAKTDKPHAKLPGTVHTAVEAVEAAGGRGLAIVCDVRDAAAIDAAVAKCVAHFGGIDVVVNNASAIWTRSTEETPPKRFDLMHQINVRGTFLVTRAALPHLRRSAQQGRSPHILTMSPPLSIKAHWFSPHVAYTVSKYDMSLFTLGWADELADDGINVNSLWPRTTIATEAIKWIAGDESVRTARTVDVMADAAHVVFTDGRITSGNFFIDDAVLHDYADKTFAELKRYNVDPNCTALSADFFDDDATRWLRDYFGGAAPLRAKL